MLRILKVELAYAIQILSTSVDRELFLGEQVEDPRSAKGLVRRDVVEVITPGLVGDPEGLDARREVSLAALQWSGGDEAGLAALDASTGSFSATACSADAGELPGARWGVL